MIKKFEIKAHDGPGRIGKLDGHPTPKIFYKNDLKIAPNEGSSYNIDREIAEFNVNETLRLAEEKGIGVGAVNIFNFLNFGLLITVRFIKSTHIFLSQVMCKYVHTNLC